MGLVHIYLPGFDRTERKYYNGILKNIIPNGSWLKICVSSLLPKTKVKTVHIQLYAQAHIEAAPIDTVVL